jgi:hypothetical protein
MNAMNEKTLFDLIKAYGQARHDLGVATHSGATAVEQRAYTEADELLNAIWRRIRNVRNSAVTAEDRALVADILDGRD